MSLVPSFFVIFYARDSRRYSNNCIIAFFLLRRIKKNLLTKKRRLKKRRQSLDIRRIVCYDQPTNSVFYSTCTRGEAKQSLRTTVETSHSQKHQCNGLAAAKCGNYSSTLQKQNFLQATLCAATMLTDHDTTMDCHLQYRRSESEMIHTFNNIQVITTQ